MFLAVVTFVGIVVSAEIWLGAKSAWMLLVAIVAFWAARAAYVGAMTATFTDDAP